MTGQKLQYFKVLCNWHFAFAYYRLIEMPYFVGTRVDVFASQLHPCIVQVSFGRFKLRPLCVDKHERSLCLWSQKVKIFGQPSLYSIELITRLQSPRLSDVFSVATCKRTISIKKLVYMVMQLKEYSCSGNQRHVELCDGQSAILI